MTDQARRELERKVAALEAELAGLRAKNEKLRLARARYQAVIENAADAVVMVDGDGIIREWPGQAELLCGWKEEEIIGRPVFHLMPEHLRKKHEKNLREVTCGQRGDIFGKRIETSVLYRGEAEVPVELTVTMTRVGDQKELVLFIHDITERKKAEEHLRHLSLTDELTGLFNRRGFITLGEKQLQAACRNRWGLFLLFADLDDLKVINDRHGHKAGDEALIETAAILNRTFRAADLIARVGGDEFVVMFSDRRGKRNEETVLARLEKNLEKRNSGKNKRFPLELSCGTVRYDHDKPCSLTELMHRADELMYRKKKERKAQKPSRNEPASRARYGTEGKRQK